MFLWTQGIDMAKLLESQIRKDPHFEIPAQRHLGLVVFSLKVFKTVQSMFKGIVFRFKLLQNQNCFVGN